VSATEQLEREAQALRFSHCASEIEVDAFI